MEPPAPHVEPSAGSTTVAMNMSPVPTTKRGFTFDKNHVGAANRLARTVWNAVQLILYRPSPTILHGWRRFLLRLFGAKVGAGAHPYPRAKIWAPWNLTMANDSCLGNDVDCYCVAPIVLGSHATVSQYSFLCTASHNYHDPGMPMIAAPIIIGAEVWVAANVFVGPGVRIGEGAVIGARSTVIRDVEAWVFVAGSPPAKRGKREPFRR